MTEDKPVKTLTDILREYYNEDVIGAIKATARLSLEGALFSLAETDRWKQWRDDVMLLIEFRDSKYKGRTVKYYSDDELKDLISEFY